MASVPPESNQSSSHIDYLSALPNELLDDIFEYAYEDYQPTQPLSKRLRPFFENHFYRRISISSFSRCSILLETISGRPHRGQIVRSMTLATSEDPSKANLDLLSALFPLVPNLTHLDCSLLTALFDHQYTISASLSNLRSVTTSIRTESAADGSVCLDLKQLAYLEDLPSLHELALQDWLIYHAGNVHGSERISLLQVERLRVQGLGAEDDSVRFLTARCPALRHLSLHSTWYDELFIFPALETHPLSLESLSLSVEDGLVVVHDEQSVLERFTRLSYLHLGDHCYDNTIPSTLLRLPLLAEIHLDQGLLEPDNLLPLVLGPNRLLFLKTIILDADPGRIGKKSSSPSTQGFDDMRDLQRCLVEMSDWKLPKRSGDVKFEVLGLKRLIKVARENGITVKGGVLSALQIVNDYHLEANNRGILYTDFHHTFDHLRKARTDARRNGVPLPPLDLDSLDINRLELVEIDLPEQEWYLLSLRNKA